MFKVGDIVVGISGDYSHTGKGSICRVIGLGDRRIRVEVMTPAPNFCTPGERFEVWAQHFTLKEETKPMKLEEIKVFYCQQGMGSGGECGEVAQHRAIIPGLAITLCPIHAKPYVSGKATLSPVMCRQDGQICKPGYKMNRDYGYAFCNDDCEELYLNRQSSNTRQYASAYI